MNQEDLLVDSALSALADQPDINNRLESIEKTQNMILQETADIRETMNELVQLIERISVFKV